MKEQLNRLALAMVNYEDSTQRIQHFTKVHAYSKLIGELEGLDERTLLTLEAAAYVHDIGIKPALVEYASDRGEYQERLGAPIAAQLLRELGFDGDITERVSYLVGHHHTYTDMDGADYQILVEADFLVNLFENATNRAGIEHAYQRIFRTETGKRLCKEMFQL